MAEIRDIDRYVEDHPGDHEQRWRLAKKLYTAWEYRRALHHLHILKENGYGCVALFRYLAATYAQMGRYAEATRELNTAIALWPREIKLYEQMASVLEHAGARHGAAVMWQKTLKLNPHHVKAKRATARLRSAMSETDRVKRLRPST